MVLRFAPSPNKKSLTASVWHFVWKAKELVLFLTLKVGAVLFHCSKLLIDSKLYLMRRLLY